MSVFCVQHRTKRAFSKTINIPVPNELQSIVTVRVDESGEETIVVEWRALCV